MALKWYDHVWPAGGVLTSALMIAWATEVASFFLSRGFAFAILALLQVLPEFAVEAVITYNAGLFEDRLHLVTANFTGANRLIVGLFIPMIFYLHAWRARRLGRRVDVLQLPASSSVEVIFLMIPNVYSLLFPLRGRITPVDAVILVVIYVVYLLVVYRMPPSHDEETAALPLVPRTIRRWPERLQKITVLALFVVGGALLFSTVHPFYENTIELGAALGIGAYFLFQWIAPFLSEFPEFVTIAYWGRTGRAQLGVTNAISSKINQWTLLVAMLPIVYAYGTSVSGSGIRWELEFDGPQRVEILLTAMQGLFASFILMDLRLLRWEAHALLVLWAIQLFDPLIDPWIAANLPTLAVSPLGTEAYIREWMVFVYWGLCIFLLWIYRGRFLSLDEFRKAWRENISAKPAPK